MAKFFTPSKLSENIKETPEGFLLCLNVPIARTGWQDYGPGETPLEVGEDGKVWIYRSAEEVFRSQTVASFNAKSVTIKHPVDFVAPANWKQLTYGVAQNIRKSEEKDEDGEEMLLADLLITDEMLIGLIKNGLREVSCGYDAEYRETAPGEGEQFNIVGNHIALVEQGRAGPTYAIKDHKGKADDQMTFKEMAEKLKILGKTVDAAAAAEEKKAEKLAKKKTVKTGDEGAPEQVTYDDMMKHIKDMSSKLDSMMGKKEEKASDEDEEEMADDEEEMMDDEEGAEESESDSGDEVMSRIKALEAAMAKLLKAKAGDDEEDMSGDEDKEESEDDAEAEDAEAEEGEESQSKKTGDEAKIEILTPGKKFKGKDARVKCLKEFAKTEDGAKVLKQLGMKKPVFDSKSNTDMVFMAASALMKSKRGVGLSGTKDSTNWQLEEDTEKSVLPKTPEQLNEINAKHFGAAK